MRNRAPLGLLFVTLALGCFEENDPVTPHMDGTASGSGTAGSGTMSMSASSTGSSTVTPTTDDPTVAVTTNSTETADTSSSGDPPVGVCGDQVVTPGELCLDIIDVVMATDPVVSVRVGDVSGSNAVDLVYLIPDQIVVRVGDGTGEFGGEVFDESVMGVEFELVDVDGDGELDMVVIEDQGPLRVLLGNGAGAFTPSDLDPVGMDPQAVATGDLDGGGALDVVVGNGLDGTLSTALGLGDGDLQPPVSFVAFGSVHDLALAEFTGDGLLDVVLTIQGGGIEGVALRPGDGSGGLLDQRITPGAMPGAEGIATGDFNADSLPDVAYVSTTMNMLGVLLGNGAGFEREALYPVGPGPTVLIADDLDGDGREDLVVGHDGEPTLRVLVPEPDGTMMEQAQIMLASEATDLDTGDANGDGATDIAAASRSPGIITLVLSAP